MEGIMRVVFWWALVSLSGFPAAALDVDSAVAEALQSNLGLSAEGKRLSSLERDKTWAVQKLFPSLTAGFGWQRWNDTANQRRLVGLTPTFNGGGTLTGLTPNVYDPDPQSLGAVVDLQLTLSLGNFAAMDKTLVDWDAGRLSYEQTRRRLEHDVRAAFYRLLALRESVALAQTQVANAQTRVAQVEAGFKNGTAPELNLLQARVGLESRRTEQRAASTALNQSLYAFSLLLGRSPTADLDLQGAIDPPVPPALDGGVLADRYAEHRNDIRTLDTQARLLDVQTSQVVAMALPQVVVGWTGDPGINDPARNNAFNPSNWSQTNGALSVQLQWKLDPFLPGSQFWTLSADLDDQKAALRQNRRQALDAARAQILSITDRLAQAASALPSLENNARDARRASVLAQAAFAAGVRSILEVQDADLQAQGSELTLLNERLALQIAWLDLADALEIPLADLKEVPHETH
jgi:outer membrane protein TolC